MKITRLMSNVIIAAISIIVSITHLCITGEAEHGLGAYLLRRSNMHLVLLLSVRKVGKAKDNKVRFISMINVLGKINDRLL